MSAGMDGEGLAGRVELVWRPCRWSDQGSQSLTLSCPHHRYEEEINRRTAAENEFVVLKKVSLEALAGMGCGRQEVKTWERLSSKMGRSQQEEPTLLVQ